MKKYKETPKVVRDAAIFCQLHRVIISASGRRLPRSLNARSQRQRWGISLYPDNFMFFHDIYTCV